MPCSEDEILKEIQKRGLKVAVDGIPEIINDDIVVDKSVGSDTIVEEDVRATNAAHVVVESVEKGTGAVKLIGRCSVPYVSKLLSGCPEQEKEFLRSTEPTIGFGLEHLTSAPLIFKNSARNGRKDPFKSLGCVRKRNQLKCSLWYILVLFLLLGSFQTGAYAESDKSENDFEVENSAHVKSDGSIMMTSEVPKSKGCIFYKRRFPSIHPLKERQSSFGFTCSFYKSDYSMPSLKGLGLTVVFTSERKFKNRRSAKTILVSFSSEQVLLRFSNDGFSSTNIRRFQQTVMAQKVSIHFDSTSSKLRVWLDPISEAVLEQKVDLFKVFGDDPIGVGLCSESQVGASLIIIKWRFELSNGAVPSPPPPPRFSPPPPRGKTPPPPPPPPSPLPPPPQIESSHPPATSRRRRLLFGILLGLALIFLALLITRLIFGGFDFSLSWCFGICLNLNFSWRCFNSKFKESPRPVREENRTSAPAPKQRRTKRSSRHEVFH